MSPSTRTAAGAAIEAQSCEFHVFFEAPSGNECAVEVQAFDDGGIENISRSNWVSASIDQGVHPGRHDDQVALADGVQDVWPSRNTPRPSNTW